MVCLDSDLLISFLRGYEAAGKKMSALIGRGERLTTTPVNVYELYHGAYCSQRRLENLEKVRELLTSLDILSLDEKSCEEAGQIRALLEAEGKKIGDADSLMAGVALRNNHKIITRNIEHFSRVQSLQLESW
jgi:predicted nucleic acid-binding protein